MKPSTVTPLLLRQMDAYWRAANHLSVGPSPAAGRDEPMRQLRALERWEASLVCPGGASA